MSQLTIYLDEKAMRDVKKAARRQHMSLSRWARTRLTAAAGESWPDGYFNLFGSLAGEAFERPPQGDGANDLKRKGL